MPTINKRGIDTIMSLKRKIAAAFIACAMTLAVVPSAFACTALYVGSDRFYNYFGIAVNCAKQMNNFCHIMEYSMYKTFADKYRSKVTKVCRKYKKDGIFTISYQNKKGKNNRS